MLLHTGGPAHSTPHINGCETPPPPKLKHKNKQRKGTERPGLNLGKGTTAKTKTENMESSNSLPNNFKPRCILRTSGEHKFP